MDVPTIFAVEAMVAPKEFTDFCAWLALLAIVLLAFCVLDALCLYSFHARPLRRTASPALAVCSAVRLIWLFIRPVADMTRLTCTP